MWTVASGSKVSASPRSFAGDCRARSRSRQPRALHDENERIVREDKKPCARSTQRGCGSSILPKRHRGSRVPQSAEGVAPDLRRSGKKWTNVWRRVARNWRVVRTQAVGRLRERTAATVFARKRLTRIFALRPAVAPAALAVRRWSGVGPDARESDGLQRRA